MGGWSNHDESREAHKRTIKAVRLMADELSARVSDAWAPEVYRLLDEADEIADRIEAPRTKPADPGPAPTGEGADDA